MSQTGVFAECALTVDCAGCLTKLRCAVGVRGSGAESGEKRIAHRSRSETAAVEPQTEARRSCGPREIVARDERAICAAERAWSRGGTGTTSSPWSVANCALVTSGLPICGLVTAYRARYCMAYVS